MTALSGLKIVDFSRFLPAAYASWVAADMGAEVIRVENPRELAKQKAMFGSAESEDAATRRRARVTYLRGKKSLCLNPGVAEARAVLHRLIAQADILIEDYRPGVMASMGYGEADMRALNPRLIYMSVSFAGQTGPMAGQAGHDPLALSLAGALARLNGLPQPSLPGLQVADVLTGMNATIAMLLALQARGASGAGQYVDVAMSESCLPLHLVNMGRYDDMDAMPSAGTWHPKGGVWACKDGGHICTTDMEPAYWARFCTAVERPDWAALQHDVAAHPAMAAELRTLFASRTRDEWTAVLRAAETQVMPVYSAEEALTHPHTLSRAMVQEVAVEGQPPVRHLSLPFHLSATAAVEPLPAPAAGADNADILSALGYDAEAQAALAKAGAFDAERRDAR